MTYRFDGYNYVLRCNKDELLVEQLTAFVEEKQIQGGWVSGLGGAQAVELGFYDLTNQQYHWQRFQELLEVTAISGTIAWQDQKPALHLHGTFSRRDYQAIGGHIRELQVGGTLEVFIHSQFANQQLTRVTDGTTGLNVLAL